MLGFHFFLLTVAVVINVRLKKINDTRATHCFSFCKPTIANPQPTNRQSGLDTWDTKKKVSALGIKETKGKCMRNQGDKR